jgi:hypothetical protein
MTTQYEIKVYKIWYADAIDDFYIGSTKLTLSRRMVNHRKCVKSGKTSLIYRTMRDKGVNNFRYCLIASCMVANVDEQRQFEQHWITELKPTLNTRMAYITEEDSKQKQQCHRQTPEYRAHIKEYSNRPDRIQKTKDYYIKHTRTCVCGGTYRDTHYTKNTHYNTDKHIEWVNDFYIRLHNQLN